jgi:hypothetical protein
LPCSALPLHSLDPELAILQLMPQQQMLVSRATPGIPSRYEWVQETYEQLTLCKYDGRPHMGKNWVRLLCSHKMCQELLFFHFRAATACRDIPIVALSTTMFFSAGPHLYQSTLLAGGQVWRPPEEHGCNAGMPKDMHEHMPRTLWLHAFVCALLTSCFWCSEGQAPGRRPQLTVFHTTQDKHDPQRVFEPELWRRIVANEPYSLKPRCQLDRSCYCQADEHCAEGFVCVPSLAFPEYKTCRPAVMN